MAATLTFVLGTLACASAAAVSAPSVAGSIHPTRGDLVAFVVARHVGTCRPGQVATGRVVALPGETVARGRRAGPDGRMRPTLVVNGAAVAPLPAFGARTFSRARVGRDAVFLLGTGAAARCDSRVLGSVRRSALVGYAQGTLDAKVGAVRAELRHRITAERYVAGVYLLVVAAFVAYLMIHSGRVRRLERELAELDRASEQA